MLDNGKAWIDITRKYKDMDINFLFPGYIYPGFSIFQPPSSGF